MISGPRSSSAGKGKFPAVKKHRRMTAEASASATTRQVPPGRRYVNPLGPASSHPNLGDLCSRLTGDAGGNFKVGTTPPSDKENKDLMSSLPRIHDRQ